MSYGEYDAANATRLADFNVAAKSLVDLSHLQETVVWVVNQIHRHQDEIAAVQARHDTDFPRLNLQVYKQRHWMVHKRYEKFVRECEGDGFDAFKKEWLRAKDERSKWTKSCRHSKKTAQHKMMRLWEEDWQYEKKCRHLTRFSLRSIRRNRLDAAVGIWFWVWQTNKRYRQIVFQSDTRRNEVHTIKGLAGFFNQWKRKKRHRWAIKKMTETRDQRTESKILSAWKFLVDFRRIRATKICYKIMKSERMIKFNVFHGWDGVIQQEKRHRGLIRRTTRYRNMRKLERAIEDWDFYVQYAKKQRLLQIDEDDVIERMATMEGRIDGIVRKDRIRPMELETAVKLVKNLNDLKLNTSAKEVQDALSKKVDKPTEEQVARRTVRMWKTGVADKSTDKTTPALGKFQSALHAKKEQRAKEEFDAKAVEDHQAALAKERKQVGGKPTLALHEGEEQLAGNVSQSARELADAVSASDADPSKLPRSPHRVLLEKQFRRELQDSAGRMVSGIAASIKRRMGEEDAGAALPGSHGAYLSPSRARDMAVRDALASEREIDVAMRDMREAEIDAAVRHMSPERALPGHSAAEMDLAMRDAQASHVDRFALEAAMRGDHLDRRLTEELRIEEALRMDAAAGRAPPHPALVGPGSPGGLARARLEVERLSGELSREAVGGVEQYLYAARP
jgi:hypothetical protein